MKMMHNTGSASGTTAVAAAALSRGPQPGWMTLNAARERAFTGEIVFEVEPEVRAYLDNGVVYFAERSTDVALSERLLAAGLVDRTQLERGTVRVGDVEHLGRLFDRDDTVDRDAVLVLTETETETLVAEIANDAYCTVRSTAYRHHPSGLHRWFAAPIDPAADRRFGGISSLETSVTDDIPGIPLVNEQTLADSLHIEWDEPIVGGARVAADEPIVEAFDDSLLQAMLDESAMQFDIVESGDVAEIDEVAELSTVDIDYSEIEEFDAGDFTAEDFSGEFDSPFSADEVGDVVASIEFGVASATDLDADSAVDADDEFFVMWPSGAADVTAVIESAPDVQELPAPVVEPVMPSVESAPIVTEPVNAETVEAGASPQSVDELAMTPIETWDEEIVAEVPADVATAVKRAIAALERITGEHPVIAPILQPSEFEEPVAVPPAAAPANPFGGFAPPSLDMSAEAIYARATAAMEAEAAAALSFDPASVIQPSDDDVLVLDSIGHGDEVQAASDHAAPDHSMHAAGVASVVFVDDVVPEASAAESNERSGALRRLIGSLRRKDR